MLLVGVKHFDPLWVYYLTSKAYVMLGQGEAFVSMGRLLVKHANLNN